MSESLVLKWGIVSSGLISQDFAEALLSLKSENHRIQAVSARKLADAKTFADRFSVPSHYDSVDQLVQDKEVNIVYVGSINSAHKDVCLKSIEAGKHVLCEKPMTLNGKEQEEVLEAAKKKGVFFMEAMWARFFPVMDKLRDEIAQKTVGEINMVVANFMVAIKKNERIYSKELGGGGVLDIGIYPIQLACLIFNHEMPIKITASGHLMESGVDECESITLLYPGQRMAIINLSTNCGTYAGAQICGEKGVLQIPNDIYCPTELILSNGEKLKFPLPEGGKTNYFNGIGLAYEAEAVRKAIESGLKEHPYMTHENSRVIMHIIDEARRQLGYKLPVD